MNTRARRASVRAALDKGDKSVVARHVAQDGNPLPLRIQIEKHGEDFFVLGRCATAPVQPASDQSRSAEATMSGTLDAIARIIEEQNPSFKCSILLVEQGRFVFGAGPSLPDDYNAAVNGYAVGPTVGSCGTAIFWNTPVIVEDIQADPLWAALAALAKKAGVAACWSHPFTGSSGNVLGALAFYAPEPCAPTAEQLSRLKAAARITGLAVERGRAEEELRRTALALDEMKTALTSSRDLLQQVIDTVPLRIFWKDREGRYLGCNPAFARDAGKASPDELLGCDDFGLGWAAQADLYRADDQGVVESGQPRLNFEEPQTTPDGKTIWLRTSKVPLYDPQGENIGVLGVYDDISEYKRQERRTALAMDAAKILVWEIDFASGKLDYEGSALANLGLDASDAPDTLEGLLARVHPDDRPHFMVQLEQALLPGTERGFDCEYRFQRPHDGYAWLHTVGRVTHRDAAGHPLLGAGYAVNIDARKLAEADLHHSNSLLVAALESTADGILVVDAHGKVSRFNRRFLELWRIPRLLAKSGDDAKLLGFVREQLVNPAEFLAKVEALYRSPGESSWDELHFLDGRVFERYSTPQRLDDGRIVGRVWSFRDVTARKQAEEALRQFKETLDQIHDCVFIFDAETLRFTYVNQGAMEQVGYDEPAMLKLHPYDIKPAYPEPLFRAMIAPMLRGDITHQQFETLHRHRDGHDIPVEIFLQLVPGGANDPSRFVAIVRDITDRKQVAAELEAHRQHLEELVASRTAELVEAKDTAEAASRAKSAFLANMSHELRTPMNGVMGMIDMAKRRMADAKGLDQLNKAKFSAERLLRVLNDILDISRIEAERLVFENIPLQLSAVIDNLVGTLGYKATDKGLRLRVDIPSGLHNQHFQGDPLRLGQILMNLVGNAIKFTDHGEVVLRARSVGETAEALQVRFEISDTGVGIDAEAQTRLFQSFEQADNSMTRKYGGTGLGLAICKRLVQLMGGEIGVKSTACSGSTFWFIVPLKKRESSAVAPAPNSATLTAEQRLIAEFAGSRVLLAEDEPITQEVSRYLLEDVSFVVDIAEDGLQALDFARKTAYALILMDMQMPVLNGVEATQAIRNDSLNKTTPILAMTANAFDEDRDACLAAGMNDHIAKPVDPDRLYETLLEWLKKRGG